MKKERSKAKVIADIKKNRLYIIFDSSVKKHDVEQIYTDVRFGVADLQPGFEVINDMSSATMGQLGGAPTFKKISDYLEANNVGRVIRVMGSNTSVIFKQVSRLSEFINGYKPEYVSTVEEAEELLDNAKE